MPSATSRVLHIVGDSQTRTVLPQVCTHTHAPFIISPNAIHFSFIAMNNENNIAKFNQELTVAQSLC